MFFRTLVLLSAVLALACSVLACADKPSTPLGVAGSEPGGAPVIATQAAEAPAPGIVRATLEASCRIGEYSAEVDLDYRARGEGSTVVTRVRLVINERVEYDSGAMSEQDLWGNQRVPVAAGRRYNVVLIAESAGSPSTSASSNVRCPAGPARLRL